MAGFHPKEVKKCRIRSFTRTQTSGRDWRQPVLSVSGKAGTNGLVTVIYAGCEVWVAGLSSPSDDEQVRLIGRLVAEFCHPGPEGRTAIVPLSNGEHSRTRDFLCRMADPNYEPAE